MEKIIKRGIFYGYKVSDYVVIHKIKGIEDFWYMNVNKLNIINFRLCEKNCNEDEIYRHVMLELKKIQFSLHNEVLKINGIISNVFLSNLKDNE